MTVRPSQVMSWIMPGTLGLMRPMHSHPPSGSSVASSGGVDGTTGDSPAVDAGAPQEPATEQASSQQQNDNDAFNPFIIVLALLGLAALAAIRPWRWLPSRGGD